MRAGRTLASLPKSLRTNPRIRAAFEARPALLPTFTAQSAADISDTMRSITSNIDADSQTCHTLTELATVHYNSLSRLAAVESFRKHMVATTTDGTPSHPPSQTDPRR